MNTVTSKWFIFSNRIALMLRTMDVCCFLVYIYIVQGNFFFSDLFNLHFLDSDQSINKQGILLIKTKSFSKFLLNVSQW